MKVLFRIVICALFGSVVAGFVSCSDDDFTDSIFDTTEKELDKSAYTYPLDAFLRDSFLVKYNLQFIYKMQDIGSDMDYDLVPARYDNALDIAVLTKYLWYDVWEKYGGKDFLRNYSPRIIHLIGSPEYNNDNTIVLGYAEGGLKITLTNVNGMDLNSIDQLNELFFKTMHHEFGHILHQNYLYPTEFTLISNSLYNPINWSNVHDSIAASQGFASAYASNQVADDWVEIIANYLTLDSVKWNDKINAAAYDWEMVSVEKTVWDKLDAKVKAGTAIRDTVGYNWEYNEASNEQYNIIRKTVRRDANDYAIVDKDGNIEFLKASGLDGKAILLRKLQMVREYLMKYFNIDLDKLREEVQHREFFYDANGYIVKNPDGTFVNKLTAPLKSNPSMTLMDSLRNDVYKYRNK